MSETHEKFSKDHYLYTFISKCRLFQKDYEEIGVLIDCSQFDFPDTRVQVFDPYKDIGDPFL